MPFYEYQCSDCGHQQEELQSITAPPIEKCEKCGENTLKRLIGTGAGLIFKGSGFYLTDYKNNKSGAGSASFSGGNNPKSENNKTGFNEKSGKETAAKETAAKETAGKETAGKETGSISSSKIDTSSNKEARSIKESK